MVCACRHSLGSLPTQQLNRVLKICDQIDSLPSVENIGLNTLSDFDNLKDIGLKLRNKLKIIDDMASSTKLTKTSGLEAGIKIRTMVSSIISNIGSCLLLLFVHYFIHILFFHQDSMDICTAKQLVLLNHLSSLQEGIQKPVFQLVTRISQLMTEHREMEKSFKLKELEAVADRPKAKKLETRTKLRSEVESIERIVEETLRPIRVVLKKKATFLPSPNTSGENYPWMNTLSTLLSCSESDLLRRCMNK